MQINGINEANGVKYTTVAKQEVKETVKPDVKGYEEKAEAPVNPNMYKAMYGVQEQDNYAEKLAEVRSKYEMDVNDKNREIENNKLEEQNPKKPEEKSYYEQYLDYKHKYE